MTSPVTPFTDYDISDLPPPRTVSVVQQASSVQLVTGIGLITAITCCDTTNTGFAAALLTDGTDATGNLLAVLNTPHGGGFSPSMTPPGILFRTGLYYDHVSGAMTTTVTYIPLLSQP